MKHFIEGIDEFDDLEASDLDIDEDSPLEEDVPPLDANEEMSSSEDSTDEEALIDMVAVRNTVDDLIFHDSAEVKLADKILESFGPGPEEEDLDLKEEFIMCVDLFKARVFKKAWHDSDLEPGAQQRW